MNGGTSEKTKILLVEDSLTQAEATRFTLQRAGFKVSVARNGRDALDRLLGGCDPDLIISDIVMPDMDGYRFCRAVKNSERHRAVPLILLTSLTDPEDVIQGLEAGADSFLTKPIEPEFLLETAANLLRPRTRESHGIKTYEARLLVMDSASRESHPWYESLRSDGCQVSYWNVQDEPDAPQELASSELVIACPGVLAVESLDIEQALTGGYASGSPALILISDSRKAGDDLRERYPSLTVYDCPPDARELRNQVAAILEIDRSERNGARVPVHLRFQGRERMLQVNLRQMLTLLLSTYGNAVRQNKKLIETQASLRELNASLESTVRERTDQLLRAERGYRTFLENTQSGYYRVSAAGEFIEVNTAFVKMLGYTNRQELFELESAASIYKGAHGNRLPGEGAIHGSVPTRKAVMVRRDGEEIHVLENILVHTTPAGSLDYVEGLVDDITQLEEYGVRMATLNRLAHLANSRLDFNSVLQIISTHLEGSIPASHLSVCVREGESGELQVASAGSIAPLDVARNNAFPFEESQIYECIETGRTLYMASVKGRDAAADTENAVLSAALVPIFAADSAIGVLAVGRNREAAISATDLRFLENVAGHLGTAMHNARLYGELKTAYQLLKETQDQVVQQERMHAIGEMASGIAHDFNNSLTAVLGFTELLINDANARKNEQRLNEFLGHVRDAALDGQEIVGRLREFYRPLDEDEALEPVALNEAVEKAVALTKPKWDNQAQERGLKIAMHRDLGDTAAVLGSFTGVREILTNLIFNSVDAIIEQHGRSGQAGDPRIVIRTFTEGDRVCLAVRDNGTGMSEEVKARCLEPFFSTKGEHGSGLGLGMVYGIVQRMGGTIRIDSAPGEGTEIVISLPAAAAPAQAAVPACPERNDLQGLRVLTVDDNPKVCTLLSTMLQAQGARVDTAGSGEQALALFEQEKHDLIITDKGMAGMCGDELAAAIKRADPNVPVILLTGYGALMLARREIPEHVDVVLTKPVRQRQLLDAIHSVLDGSAAPA